MKNEDSSNEDAGKGRLRNFKGVAGRVVSGNIEEYSFSVGINYELLDKIDDDKLLFQIGLSHSDSIDESVAIGIQKTEWSLSGIGCEHKYVCLASETAGQRLKTTPISENKHKTILSLKLTVYVDKRWSRVVIKMMPSIQIVGDFNNVDFTTATVPVFGVYNPTLANVTLTILGDDPDVLFDLTQMHASIYVSDDQKVIANSRRSSSFTGGISIDRFQKYVGVTGDISFSSKKYVPDLPYFYEVVVYIDFHKGLLGRDDFIFQTGLITLHHAGKHKRLQLNYDGAVVELVRCSLSFSDICIKAWNKGNLIQTTELYELSLYDKVRAKLSLTIELFLKESKIRISLRHPRKRLATFNNIDFSQPLLPVFGLSTNPKVSIELKTNTDIDRFSIFGYHLKEPICEM
ncbi:hypothetical protein FSP39_006791 [Pinctada imbricata]|uniref:Uncharacterized protein n=1 Tax=Pinctada imbricata TaxID=66713 RepID=A0AA88Y2P5_PINIB|nr:hypothetical protein FSP39_006791 [Pinctada imbricata]